VSVNSLRLDSSSLTRKKYSQELASVEQGFKDAEAGKVLILRIGRANRFQVRAAKVVSRYTQSLKGHDWTNVHENALVL
jgi:hypothetical protein